MVFGVARCTDILVTLLAPDALDGPFEHNPMASASSSGPWAGSLDLFGSQRLRVCF